MIQTEEFPYAGRSFTVCYGEGLTFRNAYSPDGKSVTVEFLDGPMKGQISISAFNWVALAGGEYLLSWQEESKSTVVHCDNFAKGTTRSFYTVMDGSFYQLSGGLTQDAE